MTSALLRIRRASIAVAGSVALVARVALAQQGGVQLDPKVQVAVDETVARARLQGLPTEPLVDKAFEGTAKHADPSRIVTAVRTLMSGLASARHELGASAGAPDLVAGAEVLRAGIAPDVLARLRRARPNQSLLVPLVVLADLVARGVPSSTAADAVLVLADRGATDVEFNAMQQDVQHDIQAGAAPADAATIRSGGSASDAKPASNGAAGQNGGKGKSAGAGAGSGSGVGGSGTGKGNGNGPAGQPGQPAGGKPKPPTAGPPSPTGGSAGTPHVPPGKPPKDKPPSKDKPPAEKPPKGKPPKGNNPHTG